MSKDVYKAIYLDILVFCKKNKIRVYHRKKEKMKNCDGYYWFNMISINADFKYTQHGVTVLAHEIGHYFQDKSKLWDTLFFRMFSDTPLMRQKIIDFEVNASELGQKFLFERYGILEDFDELDKDLVQNYLKDLWFADYFGQK